LIIVFESDDEIQTHLYPEAGMDYKDYAIMIAALVRHTANAFKVRENDVWEWVDKERYEPTAFVRELKLN